MGRRRPGGGEALLGCQAERKAAAVEAMLSSIVGGAAPAHLPLYQLLTAPVDSPEQSPFSVLGAQEQEVDGNLAPMASASAARGGGVGCPAGDGCRWQLCWMTQEAAGGGGTSQGDGDGGVESRWEEIG